jgi:hypothetical protein
MGLEAIRGPTEKECGAFAKRTQSHASGIHYKGNRDFLS